MRNTPTATGVPWEISPPSSGGKNRARVWPKFKGLEAAEVGGGHAAGTPSSLELCQEMGNVMGEFNSVLKS